MNSRVTIKDIVSMLLIIISFASTGIMIMNEDYKYALIALTFSAFCVLIGFVVLIMEDDDKILDLSNPSLRNPRKSNSGKRVKYISKVTTDMLGMNTNSKNKRNKGENEGKNSYLKEYDNNFYESVGNMRVYKRGEKIDYHNSEEEQE